MGTFNKSTSAQTVSLYLSKVNFLKTNTRKFFRICADGKSDVSLFKSCIGMTAKSIDVMYAMVGIIILAVKNKSNAQNVKNSLRDATRTLNKFFNLVYAGEGEKISAYLNSSDGSWFRSLVEQLITADEGTLEQMLKKIKSIRLGSNIKRNFYRISLGVLAVLMKEVCPTVSFDKKAPQFVGSEHDKYIKSLVEGINNALKQYGLLGSVRGRLRIKIYESAEMAQKDRYTSAGSNPSVLFKNSGDGKSYLFAVVVNMNENFNAGGVASAIIEILKALMPGQSIVSERKPASLERSTQSGSSNSSSFQNYSGSAGKPSPKIIKSPANLQYVEPSDDIKDDEKNI